MRHCVPNFTLFLSFSAGEGGGGSNREQCDQTTITTIIIPAFEDSEKGFQNREFDLFWVNYITRWIKMTRVVSWVFNAICSLRFSLAYRCVVFLITPNTCAFTRIIAGSVFTTGTVKTLPFLDENSSPFLHIQHFVAI